MGLGDKMFKGMVWSAVERLSIQAVQFTIQILLARILTPAEYGTIGILYVFIAISLVFMDSGFTKALIQKRNRTEDDISTVFIFNIGIGLVAYLLLFLIAPYVAAFYSLNELTLLLRVLAISLIINSLFTVPMTLYTIKLDFKSLTKINFIAASVSGGIAYAMATYGYGVWALVGLTISRSLLTAVLTWFMLKWRPNMVFSKSSLKELFSFGSNLLVSSLLNVTVNKAYELVIPKVNSLEDLGYYNRGTQFTGFIFNMVNSIFERVLLPGLTNVQNELDVLTSHTRGIIKAAALIVVPMFLLLSLVSEPLIRYLLTEKWLPAVPIMQIICFARLITIISGINVNLLYVIGRTDLALKQQYLKLTIRVILLLSVLKFGIIYIALAELASTIIHFFINTYHPGKIMKYGSLSQIKDMSLIILASIIMCASVYAITFFIEHDLLKLAISGITAVPIYVVFIRLFKVRELEAITLKTKQLFKKK